LIATSANKPMIAPISRVTIELSLTGYFIV